MIDINVSYYRIYVFRLLSLLYNTSLVLEFHGDRLAAYLWLKNLNDHIKLPFITHCVLVNLI